MRSQAIHLAVALIGFGAAAAAATLSGVYTTTTPAGSFILTLEQNGGGQITGTLVGGGLDVQVSGTLQGAAAEGILTSAQGQSYFRVEAAGDGLKLTVVDPDAYGQPDFATAQHFLFRRQERETPAAETPAPAPRAEEPPRPAKLAGDEIGDPVWGFAFKAPEGWVHRKTAEGVVLGSNTEKGLILVLPHAYNSLQELRAAALEGIVEGGAQLMPSGPVEAFGDNGLSAEYEGVAEGRPAKAFAIGMISPHGGGATILSAVESASYSAAYAERVEAMALSVRFWRPETPPVVGEWRQKLSGHCVAYLSTYSSSGPSYGGYSTGGYSSSKSRYYLYPDGRFEGSSSTSVSIDTGGAFGSGGGASGPRSGRWQVVAAGGGPVLDLEYPDGSRAQHRLSTNEKGHTLLDGERWFVVSYEECHDL